MYKEFKVDLTNAQGLKVLHGKAVRLSHSQLNKGHPHYFHPENYKKLVSAYEKGKGCVILMSHGAVLRTHQSGLSGSGFWGSLWKGIKTGATHVGKFLKDNWKPLAGTVMDGIVASQPEAAPVRGMIKSLTGVGLTKRKGRVVGGSFRLG
jgi:hypothetical protein